MQCSESNKDSACCISFISWIIFLHATKILKIYKLLSFLFRFLVICGFRKAHGQGVSKLFAAAIHLFIRNYGTGQLRFSSITCQTLQ